MASPTFSRHDRVNKLPLFVWLNEKVRYGTGPKCKWKKKSLRISASSLNSQFSILNLLGDVDFVDLGLLAGGTGEEVLGSDDGGAFVTLDLLYPELHC